MKIGSINIETTPISQTSNKGIVRTVYPCPITPSACPCCGGELQRYTCAIQITSKDCVKLFGVACYKCYAFFSNKQEIIKSLDKIRINKSTLQIRYTFNRRYNATFYASIFSKLKSVYCQITICSPHRIQIYTIVTSKQDENLDKYILHYTNRIALELLTAIISLNRNVRLGTENLVIINVRLKGAEFLNDAFHVIRPSNCVEVVTQKNGGYYENECAEDLEHVNGLAFFESSPRLEIMPVSYNKQRNLYYVDKQIFNHFQKKYGYLIATYVSSKTGDILELRDESLLHILGYNVNSVNNLSDAERQKKLASFVELGFMDAQSIVRHLTFLIRLNGATHINACEKWERDLAFIMNYKVDPDRFVFVSKVRRL